MWGKDNEGAFNQVRPSFFFVKRRVHTRPAQVTGGKEEHKASITHELLAAAASYKVSLRLNSYFLKTVSYLCQRLPRHTKNIARRMVNP